MLPLYSSKLAVPSAYRAHLTREKDKWQRNGFAYFAAVVALISVIFHGSVASSMVVPFLLTLDNVLGWQKEKKQSVWTYNENGELRVIWQQVGGRIWYWRRLGKNVRNIEGVEETVWNGLPALRILTKSKNPRHRPDLWIVYAPEDREKVETLVLPRLEKMRRQSSLAERLRRE